MLLSLPPHPANVEIERLARTIVDRFAPRDVIVFGSYARGDSGPDSDVDFLVVLDEVPDQRKTAVAIRLALNPRTLPIDVIVTTPDRVARMGHLVGSILRPALQEGVTLYHRAVS